MSASAALLRIQSYLTSMFAGSTHTHAVGDVTGMGSGMSALLATPSPATLAGAVGGPIVTHTYMASDQTITAGAGNTTLMMTQALAITSGKMYRYVVELYCVGVSGTPVITVGVLTTGNGAAVSSHRRGVERINSNTFGSSASNAADLSTALTAVSVVSTSPTIFVIRGIIVCSASGTITPVVSCTGTDITMRAGSFFELKQLN